MTLKGAEYGRTDGLPDYIEVEPGRRKPFALCTREELCAHAVRLMDRAVWEARDAAETAELDGGADATDRRARAPVLGASGAGERSHRVPDRQRPE